MSQLEPMSEEEIKEFLAHHDVASEHKNHLWSRRMGCVLLAWIYERAMKEKAEYLGQLGMRKPTEWIKRTDTDWIIAVKKRVGWKDE